VRISSRSTVRAPDARPCGLTTIGRADLLTLDRAGSPTLDVRTHGRSFVRARDDDPVTASGLMVPVSVTSALAAVLERYWGFREFRPLQREAMEAVLADRDSVVVLPTGGGKSLCFQAPALVEPNGGPGAGRSRSSSRRSSRS
jgi:hypothetical protein